MFGKTNSRPCQFNNKVSAFANFYSSVLNIGSKIINRELKHRRLGATNSNRKLTVPFVGLFLLLVLDWKTLVLMSGDLPLQM